MAGPYHPHLEFADLLRRARHAAGLTQEELAEKASVSARGISDLERGARQVPQHLTISLIADALNLSDTERAEWEHARRVAARNMLSPGKSPGVSQGPLIPVSHAISNLVGRQRETFEIATLLHDSRVRLLTLTGTGGVGKTRLALATLDRVESDRFDDVRLVLLAPLSDHREVVAAIAAEFSIVEQPGNQLLDLICDRISDLRLLLILDNVEHVIEAAPDIARMLAVCQGLKVMATGRRPLLITGEHEYPVEPLALPDERAGSVLDQISRADAIQLFVDRARAIQPSFTLTNENAENVMAICRKLDGLPLAIELAAARIRVLSTGDLLARLDQPLVLLTGGPRDLPDRQRTLRSTIAWSYDLLSEDVQGLFQVLSICRGGWTIEAAAALSGWGDTIVDGVDALIEHSLVHKHGGPEHPTRYGMLETVREFGLDQLAEAGEVDQARNRHARHYFDWVERNVWDVYRDSGADSVSRIEFEVNNLRAAFDWSLSPEVPDPKLLDMALRAGFVLWGYWRACGRVSEGRRWLELALSRSEASEEARMDGLNGAGFLAKEQGDLLQAIAHHEESLSIALDRDDVDRQAYALWGLGRAAMWHGDQQRAIVAYEQALGIARQLGRHDWICNLLGGLGMARLRQGDYEQAEAWLREGLAAGHEDGLEDPIITMDIAHILTLRGDCDAARELLLDSLPVVFAQGPSRLVANALEEFAWLAIQEKQPARAAQLLGAATSLRAVIGAPLPPADRARYEQLIAPAKQQISAAAWEAGLNTGTTMTLDDAVAYATARAVQIEASLSKTASEYAAGLSAREVEVLGHAAQGMTNAEIGEALYISPRTVAQHLRSVYNKLGVNSRTAAVARWAELTSN